VATGVATAGLAGGMFLYLQGDAAEGNIRQLQGLRGTFPVGSEAKFEGFARDLNVDRNWAVAIWIGAGVSAVAAVVMYVLSGGGADPRSPFSNARNGDAPFAVHF
jgi:hypothetical protein